MQIRTKIVGAVLALAAVAAWANVTCPIDKMTMMFTGNTRVEMGKLLKEHKCINGHVTWLVS